MRLTAGEVHCWCVGLDVAPRRYVQLQATLASDERSRGARFRFERDRRRFVVARGALRALLGRYLGTDPGAVRFTYNAFGKPALSPECGTGLSFNLSHAAGLGLIAIVADADVGVDVEDIRVRPDHAAMARQFFTAAAADQLERLPSHLQAEGFLGCWTRTEALLKARGTGFSEPVTTDAGDWSVYTLRPAPGYIGAVAVSGSGWRLRQCGEVRELRQGFHGCARFCNFQPQQLLGP